MIQSLPAANITPLVQYVSTLPDEVMKFNVFAIVIFLILLYIAVYVIQKLTTLLVFVLKKVFLFIIVTLAFYQFVLVFVIKLESDGLVPDTILFGIAGGIIGFFAFVVSLYVAFHSIRKIEKPANILKQTGPPEGPGGDSAGKPVKTEEPEPVSVGAPHPEPDNSTGFLHEPSPVVETRENIREGPVEKRPSGKNCHSGQSGKTRRSGLSLHISSLPNSVYFHLKQLPPRRSRPVSYF
jgi:hypothetical protein